MVLIVTVLLVWLFTKPNFDFDKEEQKLFIHYWWRKERKTLIINF